MPRERLCHDHTPFAPPLPLHRSHVARPRLLHLPRIVDGLRHLLHASQDGAAVGRRQQRAPPRLKLVGVPAAAGVGVRRTSSALLAAALLPWLLFLLLALLLLLPLQRTD